MHVVEQLDRDGDGQANAAATWTDAALPVLRDPYLYLAGSCLAVPFIALP